MKPLPALKLGPDVVQLLLPHRRPLLMVDGVTGYERGPVPTLRACRHISPNEEVFAGHFPGLHLWPGVYVIEGMGQSCNLLEILWNLQDGWESHGGDPEQPLAALRNLEQGFRLQPGYRAEASAELIAVLDDVGLRMGYSAAVDVKLLLPVFAGQRIDYHVRRTHKADRILRHEVEAEVEGKLVAKGVMHGARGLPFPSLPKRGA